MFRVQSSTPSSDSEQRCGFKYVKGRCRGVCESECLPRYVKQLT